MRHFGESASLCIILGVWQQEGSTSQRTRKNLKLNTAQP